MEGQSMPLKTLHGREMISRKGLGPVLNRPFLIGNNNQNVGLRFALFSKEIRDGHVGGFYVYKGYLF